MNKKRATLATALGVCLLATTAVPALAAGGGSYTYHVTGNAANVAKTTTGGLMLAGGGTDVDNAFRWLINKSGGGDIVVIRASGTDAYNPYIYGLGSVDSVETIITTRATAASDAFVLDKVRNAEALFIAGGDQWNYVSMWKDTPLETAINELAAKGVPIGGTSAGLAVLGEQVFTAQNGSVYSDETLANPYNRYMTLDENFLGMPNMGDTITDSHFGARDRMGRLMGFLARNIKDGRSGTTAKGMGIDEATAFVVEANGTGQIMGAGSAYFLKTTTAPEVCVAGQALTLRNVNTYKISAGGTFSLATWGGTGGTSYSLSAVKGVLSSSKGSVY